MQILNDKEVKDRAENCLTNNLDYVTLRSLTDEPVLYTYQAHAPEPIDVYTKFELKTIGKK